MTRQEYLEMYDIVGVAMEVYNTLGRGLAEQIYQEAFLMEVQLRQIEIEREKKLTLTYKGRVMEKAYYVDFYYHGFILEFKALSEITSDHRAQLFNYMRITHQNRGVIFNFGETKLHTERYLYLPEIDDFILLTHDNYLDYITD